MLLALAVLPSAVLCAEASLPSPDLLIQQVEAHYNSAKSLSVNFTEAYSILGHARPVETGTLTLRKAGKMRWDYSQPKGKLFISDGKVVYLYTAANHRVERVPLKATDDMRAPLAFLLGKLDMRKEFRDFSIREGDGGWWLVAGARNDNLPYRTIEMLVSRFGHISQLVVRGRDESLTSYRFEDEKVNPPVSDAAFHFQIPAGAEVLDAPNVQTQGAR